MIVWTLVFNIVTGNIVTPLVYGRMVHLHPAIVLVAIPAGAAIAGMLGHVHRRARSWRWSPRPGGPCSR